jgi:hypothetical protein
MSLRVSLYKSYSIMKKVILNEWFAEPFFIPQRLKEDYKCTTFSDVEMMNQII